MRLQLLTLSTRSYCVTQVWPLVTYGIYYAQIVCYAVYLLMSSTQVRGMQEVTKDSRTGKREEGKKGRREGEEGK